MPLTFLKKAEVALSVGKRRIRVWPALFILFLDAVYSYWLWNYFTHVGRQYQVLGTLIGQTVVLVLLIVWLLYFSRIGKRVKVVTLSILAICGIAFLATYRFVALTGDLVPIFEPRWSTSNIGLTTGTVPAKTNLSAVFPAYADYPQFRGPDRSAVLSGPGLTTDWDSNPPQLIWRRAIGEGWSGFAIAGEFAVTQEQDGPNELVTCYSRFSGERIWRHEDRGRFDTVVGGTGPRATPTVVDARVYTLGATGHLNSLDLTTGERIWHKELTDEPTVAIPPWGFCGSPLVVDSLVVVCAGGQTDNSMIAYHKDSGERLWAAGSDSAEYSSPQLARLRNTPQILIFSRLGIFSHKPQTGQILWNFSWPLETRNVAQPLVLDDKRIVVSSGYGVGSKLVQIGLTPDGRFSTDLIWESIRLKAKFASFVGHNGYIYGLDDGILTCIDVMEGNRMWKRGRYGHGQLILVSNKLLVSTEKGEVVLVEANHEEFIELCRFQAIEGKTWNTPALAGPHLLVRNSREAACYELPIEAENDVSLNMGPD